MGALIPYFGGKSRLAKTIISKFPEHKCYVEVFAGGASVFFAKEPSQVEIINDLDKDLITLYRAVKYHPEELYKQFKFSLVGRDEFNRQKNVNPETLTDIQRAARYLYLQKTAFGGHITGQTYGTATTSSPRLNLFNLQSTLENAWERLARVNIECLDFRELISKYDRPHTLFFLDPPYWNRPGYKFDFQVNDFLDLKAHLLKIEGKFVMTINEKAEVREIFSPFTITNSHLRYSVSPQKQARQKPRVELIITN